MLCKNNNKKSLNKLSILFLPFTAAILPKKTPSDKPNENSLNFHLEMINKIDKLLAEHDQVPQSTDSVQTPPIIPTQPAIPIEPRSPLNKPLSHREIGWTPQVTNQIIPEEFKTELNITPEFRFITKQEFIDTLSQMQSEKKEHIEIIDFGTLEIEKSTSQKKIDFMDFQNQPEETPGSFLIDDVVARQHHHKKIEIIDAQTLKQKRYHDVFRASAKQAEQIDNKAKMYFLNKNSSDKKHKKTDTEQAYIPDDFEERWKKLKQKQSKDQEQQQQEEKIDRLLRQNPKKFEEIIVNKTEPTEKKHELFNQENKMQKEAHHTDLKSNQKEIEKEKIRLQRFEERQRRIEERLQKKREKHELKIKQKQLMLQQKEEQKQPPKTEKNIFPTKEKTTQSLEFDEEVKKVLLMTDILLEELPEDILTDFMHSEDFKLYAKVLNRFKAK